MYRSYSRGYSDIKSDLNNYLNENIFLVSLNTVRVLNSPTWFHILGIL